MANKVKKTATDKTKNEIIILIPVIFMLTVFLFCVRGSVVETHMSDLFWFTRGEYVGELYTYFRMQIFVLLTVVFGIYMLISVFMGDIKINKHKVYIPMAVYSLFVIVSFAFSEYKNIALWGVVDRHEGTVALLCYMAILFYTMHAVKSEKAVKLIVKCFAIACAVLGVWGILQHFGMDMASLPEWMYLSSALRGAANIAEKQATDAVTLFFNNQNYTSFFLGLPICVFAMGCIASEDNKKKIAYAALTGVMMFCLWQASSLGGMVGLAVSVVAAVFIAGPSNIIKWKKSLGLLVLAGIISIGASLPVVMRELKSGTVTTALGFETAYAEEKSEAPLKFVTIDYVITEGENIIFSFAGNEIKIETENGDIKRVIDETGEVYSPERGLVNVSSYIDDESGYNVIEAKTANYTWRFTVFNGEMFFFAPSGKGIKLDKVESLGFENSQAFATYRGYIWSRTLPLLKETVLFGKGADTFSIYFPQDDYAGRYNIGYLNDTRNTIVDKPHNMYLGSGVNTGVISMIAFIAIFVIYILESIKAYRKHEYGEFKDYIGMGILIAIIGFMVAGLVNDSTIQITPVVYVLLGVGFAINGMIKKEKL